MRLALRNQPARPGRAAVFAAFVGAAVLVTGCAATGQQVRFVHLEPNTALSGSPFDPESPPKYVLCPGDQLLVRFPADETLDQQARIRSDGMISLPYVGDVQAAQRSPAELAEDLNGKYQTTLRDANVTVIVTEETGRRVYLGGAVQRPGALPLHGQQTLTQALFESGGLTEYAHADQILVMRARQGEGTYLLQASLPRILAGQDADVRLEPFDIVHVPVTAISSVNQFIDQYVNRMIPRPVAFPFTTELHNQPVRVISNGQNLPAVEITR